MAARIRITSVFMAFSISLGVSPLTSAAKGSTGILTSSTVPSGCVTVSSLYNSSSGKDSAGSPSINTASTRSLPRSATKVSISFLHHSDSRSLGEQITISHSLLCNAWRIGSSKLLVRGSSSLSRNTLSIFVFWPLRLFATLRGKLKASNCLCRFSATNLSSSVCR